MARQIQVLRHVYRITERRDGAVYKTEFVETKWVSMEEADSGRPNGDPDLVWVTVSDPNVQTIRSIRIE